VNRREFICRGVAVAATMALPEWLAAQALRSVPGGRLIRTMPLGRFDGRPSPAFHRLLLRGLDARQFTDLALVTPERLVTPTEEFYVRTEHPPLLPPAASWSIAMGAPGADEQMLAIGALARSARGRGEHVMECAGNSDPANFGLLSAASFDGVPVVDLFDRMPRPATASRILVTGVDDETSATVSSSPGASWVFTPDELERSGAFLATTMNGAPLTPNHGAPVRLVVPGYYGCSCIKWVTRIEWVPDDAPATLQMKEFSARTHQSGVVQLARDYDPPVIDLAAMPVRVEQWAVSRNGREQIEYRVVGVRWGGGARRAPLTIRFKHTEPFVTVDDVPDTPVPTMWSLWSHTWRPDTPGRYQVALSVSDRGIRTRRLDLFFYTREVEIDRV
jgi:hypothetical protein